MKIFNSMNQKVEEFKPLHENEVHMYAVQQYITIPTSGMPGPSLYSIR